MGFYSEHHHSIRVKFSTWNTIWNLKWIAHSLYVSSRLPFGFPSVVPCITHLPTIFRLQCPERICFVLSFPFSFKVIFLLRFPSCLPHCLAGICAVQMRFMQSRVGRVVPELLAVFVSVAFKVLHSKWASKQCFLTRSRFLSSSCVGEVIGC